MTHDDIFDNGGLANMMHWDYTAMGERLAKDERCAGPGLAAYFVKGVLDRNIPMHTGVNVEALIMDGDRVAGVRATRDGETLHIRAHRGEVVAVSGHERNTENARTHGQLIDQRPVAQPTIDGARRHTARRS